MTAEDLQKAVVEAQKELREAEELLGPDDPVVADCLFSFANALRAAGADESLAAQYEERAQMIKRPAGGAKKAAPPPPEPAQSAEPVLGQHSEDEGNKRWRPAETKPKSADNLDYGVTAERVIAQLEGRTIEDESAEEDEEEDDDEPQDLKEKLVNVVEKAKVVAGKLEAVAVETETKLAKGKKIETKTVVVASAVLLFCGIAGIGIFTLVNRGPVEAPVSSPTTKTAVTATPTETAQSPEALYSSLSDKIDEELSGKKDYAKLKELALKRLDAAISLKDEVRICKSADFAAFTADMLKQPDEALKYFDVHARVAPDKKTLDAKLALFDRYKEIKPPNETELKLLQANRVQEASLNALSSISLDDPGDLYSLLLGDLRKNISAANASATKNLTLSEDWLLNKYEDKFERALLTKQTGKDLNPLEELSSKDLRSQIKFVGSAADLESDPVYVSAEWKKPANWPGYSVYVDASHSMSVVLQTAEDGKVTSWRVIILDPSSHVASVDKCFAKMMSELVFGIGASDFEKLGGVLSARLNAARSATPPGRVSWGDGTLEILCDKAGNFVGLEGRPAGFKPWDKALTCKALLKSVNPASKADPSGPEYLSTRSAKK